MGNTIQDARKAPRGWLWLARGVIAFLLVASLLVAVAILSLFVESASGHWRDWKTIFWFTACVAALSCGLVPYILVAWNYWRERTRTKGLFQALIIGTFWFFAGWILPADLAFHGTSGYGPTGISGSYADLLETSLGFFLGCTVPALLLLISGMKLVNFRAALNPVATAPAAGKHTGALHTSLGTVLVLLLFPAGLGLFTLRRDLPILYVVAIETMLLMAAIPYALVWRNLRKGALRSWGRKTLAAMATGLLALFATVGVSYGIIYWDASPSQPHRMSTWAELVFFALLAMANIGVLLAGRSYAWEAEGNTRFASGALAISLCLVVFGFFTMLTSASI